MGDSAARVLRIEAASLMAAAERLDNKTFEDAQKLLADARGPIITMGVGVSGTVARKLAATFTSTGSPAVFLHPSDALHGPLYIGAAALVAVVAAAALGGFFLFGSGDQEAT
ncbi:hypothetical protein AB0F74_37410, partial [Nocardia salmonicida]